MNYELIKNFKSMRLQMSILKIFKMKKYLNKQDFIH